MLRVLVPLVVLFVVVSGQDNAAELQGSPGWAAAVAEDLHLAATIDTSKPPKTCRPEIISKIDFGVATAAYQVSLGSQFCPTTKVNCQHAATQLAAFMIWQHAV
jgi:hypothetical protein